MFTSQDPYATEWKRPEGVRVSVSQDGTQYKQVYSPLSNTGNGFHAGPHIFIGGPWGKVETLFPPVIGRYLKISFPAEHPNLISELFIFQTDGTLRQDSSDEFLELKQLIIERNVDFVLADRWVSARLRELFKDERKKDIALARYSTKYKNTPLRYIVNPKQGQAVVCDRAVADECEKVLVRQYGQSVIADRLNLQNYAIFLLADAEVSLAPPNRSALLWNGHFPLRTEEMKLLAPWFHTHGLPVWRKDFTKTKNFYHDSWTNGDATLLNLDYSICQGKDKELVLYTHGWRPGNDMRNLQLKLIANGETPLQFKEQVREAYVFSLPETLARLDSLEIQSTTFVPPGQDSRELGVDVKRIEIQ